MGRRATLRVGAALDGTGILREDPGLAPFENGLRERWSNWQELKSHVEHHEGSLVEFARRGYKEYGLHRRPGGVEYVEWVPGVTELCLVGDFNAWEVGATPGACDEFGVWRVWVPDNHQPQTKIKPETSAASSHSDDHAGDLEGETRLLRRDQDFDTKEITTGISSNTDTNNANNNNDSHETGRLSVKHAGGEGPAIPHGSHLRVAFRTVDGEWVTRIPAHVRSVQPARGGAYHHNGVAHFPALQDSYQFKHPRPRLHGGLKIYEAHVGMASQHARVGTYREFAREVLPRIKALGYNAVQLMAVAEHALYSSFGYQVTNFFAVSHRSGTPEDLKELVDTAHSMGMLVLMDVVHAHASSNTIDGLNGFNGSESMYFQPGEAGHHRVWGTRCFDYGSYEVLRFLMSNLLFWIEEYQFDGYRFDGVTAMLFFHRGIEWDFVGGTSEYFSHHVDAQAVAYLTAANHMLREALPQCLTVAEDVSGFAGLCRPVLRGGVGFDFRLGMGPPDQWQRLALQFQHAHEDVPWSMSHLVGMLVNRHHKEQTVGYTECHDQALVGGQSMAFALMGAEMYEGMSAHGSRSPKVERGVALHKMTRLLTLSLGGEAYLNFMGNEFGHPDWIDFPREGNNESFEYARRRWDLADNTDLLYSKLQLFDAAMLELEKLGNVLRWGNRDVAHVNDDGKVIVFEVSGILFERVCHEK